MTKHIVRRILVASSLLAAQACGASLLPAQQFRYADLTHDATQTRHMLEQPFILEFAPGDRLPIDMSLDAELFQLEPATPALALVAKRRCFVRVDAGGIHAGADKSVLARKPASPGSFFLGFTARAQGPALRVAIKTPRLRP